MAKRARPNLEKLDNPYLLDDKFMMPGFVTKNPYVEWAAVPCAGRHNRYMVIHNGEILKACNYQVAYNLMMKHYSK